MKAQASGTITAAPVAEGSLVDKDTLLCGLDVEGATAKAREAIEKAGGSVKIVGAAAKAAEEKTAG